MSKHHRRHRRLKIRSLYIWHRYIGILVALFAILLAISGILLNHSSELQLGRKFIANDWLLAWYGAAPPAINNHFSSGDISVTHSGDHLFFNQQLLSGNHAGLSGINLEQGLVVIATDSDILLLTTDGKLIEQQQHGRIVGLGKTPDGRTVLKTPRNLLTHEGEFLSWSPTSPAENILWSQSTPPSPNRINFIEQQELTHWLTWERLLLDLHSGRLLGRHGHWVMDIAGLGILFLALSGLTLWIRMLLRQR